MIFQEKERKRYSLLNRQFSCLSPDTNYRTICESNLFLTFQFDGWIHSVPFKHTLCWSSTYSQGQIVPDHGYFLTCHSRYILLTIKKKKKEYSPTFSDRPTWILKSGYNFFRLLVRDDWWISLFILCNAIHSLALWNMCAYMCVCVCVCVCVFSLVSLIWFCCLMAYQPSWGI